MREVIQERAGKFIENNPASLIKAGTGVGKSLIALKAAIGKTLIVYQQTTHLQNWKDEIIKHKIDKDITVTTYGSIHKVYQKYGGAWDTIILDECHHITNIRLEKLKAFKTDRWICLSATVSKEKFILLKKLLPNIKVFTYKLDTAIIDGVLPNLDIRVIYLELDKLQKNLTYQKNKKTAKTTVTVGFNERSKKVDDKTNLHIKCSEWEYNQILSNEVHFWQSKYEETGKDWQHVLSLRRGGQRKTFLANLKTEKVKKLLSKIQQDKRILVFTNNIDQCENIANGYPCVHSKNPDSLSIVEGFNFGDLSRLYNVNMLVEGMNLSDLDITIIVSLDGNVLPNIQMIGRSTRGKDPIIYIFVIKGTQDESNFNYLMREIKQPFKVMTL